jgi:hypothetical protein
MEWQEQTGKSLGTIRGLVIPAFWDEGGKVTGLSISTHNEEQYVVEGNEYFEKLLQLVGQETVITGKLRQEGRDKFIIPHCIHDNAGQTKLSHGNDKA